MTPDHTGLSPFANLLSMPSILRLSTLSLACLAAQTAFAQSAPDAGQTLQQLAPRVQPPAASTPLSIQPPTPAATPAGGALLTLKAVSISGATVFSESELLEVLGPVTGQSHDLAGLRTLAARIDAHYRAAGYPFARTVIPAQSLSDGQLRLQVVEGRYGQVSAISADPILAAGAQPFLQALQSDALIEGSALERTTLLLDDLPGLRAAPVLRPGAAPGTGDLLVQVSPEQRVSGELGYDNHGNRFTGYHRLRGQLTVNEVLAFGDQLSLRGLYTSEQLWLGALGYSAPLGHQGWRLQLGYAHTAYELGKEFANLDANGTARVTSAGLSYPLVRSQRSNVTASATLQHKQLRDDVDTTQSSERKRSGSLPLALQFDHRDQLGGGGITYGNLSWTPGHLNLDATLLAADTLGTAGSFQKINLDLVRAQALQHGFSAYLRFSGQVANKNLDSSEGMSLGGAGGVRAYPTGEGTGDEGWLTQFELRYALGAYTPYAFYDHGSIRTDAQPLPGASNNSRSLAGAGLGLRHQRGAWNLDASLAWRTHGGSPTADTHHDSQPRVWVSLGYRY